MKLCFLANAQDVHTQKWVSYFVNNHYDVHLISFLPANIPGVTFHPVRRTFPIMIKKQAPEWGKIGYFFHLDQIKKLIWKIVPDILHAHWASSYGLFGAYSKFHPFILSTWGNDIFDFPHVSIVHKKILVYTLRQADYITATSHILTSETKKYLGENKTICTIPFGVDIKHFQYTKREKRKTVTIGIVKKLEKKYGLDYLIKAVAKLLEINFDVKLLIVGQGSEELYLKKLTRTLNIENNIQFLGFVKNNKVPECLAQMDIFVVPSIRSSETFGVAAVEAAACGLPVIASNIGGLPEVVVDGKTGFLVPPRNPDAIADKLIALIQNIDLRRKMGKEARRFVEENYVWEENASRMDRLYKQILGTP